MLNFSNVDIYWYPHEWLKGKHKKNICLAGHQECNPLRKFLGNFEEII